ncbi:hypothetical protein LTR08_001546 [Meristemomyces frigidus]|nr:hypothetical protein LTR08_001546 [Meristemomyces frigidus]
MPQHKRGPWSQTEDQHLVHLVHVHGAHNWVRISSTIQTRSPKQCRERFHQNLKPNLNHDPITPDEGLLIEQMVAEMGKRWAEIARRLRGRSDNAVKNWWNGGMNRRRRSHNSRRTELEVRQQPLMTIPSLPPPPTHQHPLPSNFPQHSAAPYPYFGQPMYHPALMQQHQPFSVPSNGPLFHRHSGLVETNVPLFHRHSGFVETPLPSPSALSPMSADGAPSLISDHSSLSGRSPHNGPSPIELPPLSVPGSDRRQSAGFSRLGVPVSYADVEHPQRLPMKQPSRMMHESFTPQQYAQSPMFTQPSHYLPSQSGQPFSAHTMAHPLAQQQHHMPSNPLLPTSSYHQGYLPSTPAPSVQPVQLPSLSKLVMANHNAQNGMSSYSIDPALTGVQSILESSPKDKMSLSNLTH